MNDAKRVTVIKNDACGAEVWRWEGEALQYFSHGVLLQAYFNHETITRHEMVYQKGDRFREIYFTDKWFNIFEMHDAKTDLLKGWYCNFSRPAKIGNGKVEYDDLALDVLVRSGFEFIVLDKKEYEGLALSAMERKNVSAALQEVHALFSKKHPDVIDYLVS